MRKFCDSSILLELMHIDSICRNGVNGEQCIKRAICETSQLGLDTANEPHDFIKEILRTVFR